MTADPLNQMPDQVGWWLGTGPDRCVFCLSRYHAEVGYYCSDCDRPMCPACATETYSTHELRCPDCSPRATGDER